MTARISTNPDSRAWRPEDAPDQHGRVALITGSNSGLGYHMAETLARLGARVILACRNEQRAKDAADRLTAAVPSAAVEVVTVDVADLDSVAACVSRLLGELDRLDLLVNNAGLYGVPRRSTTAQGFELQFGTNHLGAFALTGRLLPLLRATPGSRVVAVSSLVHLFDRLDLDDLNAERRYNRHRAYARSKLANLLFTVELDRRLRHAGGPPPLAVAAHPGLTTTNLAVNGPGVNRGGLAGRVLDRVNVTLNPIHQHVSAGALPLLYAALSPDAEGGRYYGPHRVVRGEPTVARRSAQALDPTAGRRLWEASEAMTGVTYTL